jgi:hypothetical protein
MQEFRSNDEFWSHIDRLSEALCNSGFVEDGKKLHLLLHEVAWTTSTELFGELKLAFIDILKKGSSLPQEIQDDIKESLATADNVLNRR